MDNRKTIFAIIIGGIFLFAGYNLWSYFKEQQAIQQAEDRAVKERKIVRQEAREHRKAEEAARIERERQQEIAEEKAQNEEIERKRAEREAKRKDEEQRRAAKKEASADARLRARIAKARTRRHIEGLDGDEIKQFRQVSANYIRDNPNEFLGEKFNARQLGSNKAFIHLMLDDSNPLMLYAAISPDIDIIKALIDIGIDVNSKNKAGYTPLMFASAYNTPEVVRFLIGQGANISARAYKLNMNALHAASFLNPNPDVIDVLVNAGIPIEQETENDYTALLIAVAENKNLEVAERLSKLGANTKVYDEKGKSVHTLAKNRINGEGSDFISISETVMNGYWKSFNRAKSCLVELSQAGIFDFNAVCALQYQLNYSL